jgi:hypothetical protein
MGDESILSKSKPKLYCSMESDEDSVSKSGKSIDKGKGVDLEAHPNYYGGNNESEVSDNESKSLDKGKGIDRAEHPFYEQFRNKAAADAQKPSFDWSNIIPRPDVQKPTID